MGKLPSELPAAFASTATINPTTDSATDTAQHLVTPVSESELPKIGRLGELFLEKGLLTTPQIEEIARTQIEKNLRFGDAALSLGFLTSDQLNLALSEQFGYASKNLLVGKAHPSLKILHYPFCLESEEIRRLRSELLLKFEQKDKIKITIVSPANGEGKSYMAASLAIALSQSGKRTLLIDADLRDSAQQDYFGLDRPDGLSSILAGRKLMDDVLIKLMPNLHILPAGPKPPNPLEILRAPNLHNLLASCWDQFDAFVVDTHASSLASDAQIVSHQIGAALVLARKDVTQLALLRQTMSDLQAAGVEILGTVYNQLAESADDNDNPIGQANQTANFMRGRQGFFAKLSAKIFR
ncbi:polysaccharide biosynthesis tyrosine autokinase [Undibacterium sp. RTI2.1]|uniref:polysaccharide biosynthesis tyrosine autokinase n=1 Tax=unclassified Undibacterium TaxID=2630295 RepID=UPI002AB3EEC9|nr:MULTISPECIES: polysaccharide biosynthesis tyrosine autokinase [unclassified Undibacterium]MDY7538222.1 polysaccharide biosynthesis tyrosine autokinase [Undibacterium sp. 5I1]MEB0030870.1 polysaccharide biosynthesis tyrosine autokinase [Undibacterium sp. RTI2.1]MEB0117453.1 polysaccharide biosynthesis tyrosine autokinase [Undibacterium sp. RTI2.2]MEB0232590.1 polysaccharide biosynthesis tyrosine autokinase [Undibacterium sp. 10I3]MEB0259586.1 polysaccharide biosynthesis tyrosine autokinase [